MATKTTKKNIFETTADSLKAGISDLHEEVLTTTDKMVDISLQSGAKWQKLMGKMIHKGTGLLEKQQDIAFNTLEEVKSQYITSNKRFKQLLGFDNNKAKKAAKLQKEAKAAARKKVNKVADKVSATVKAATPKVTKTTEVKDDLKVIKGIGPKVESFLQAAGINSFADLAATPTKKLQAILDKAGSRFQSMDPAEWKAQAKQLVD